MTVEQVTDRLEKLIQLWHVSVDEIRETPSSVLAFGSREDQPVVLKVVRERGDEWRCGEVLNAFAGNGVVRVLESVEGAVLLERLSPGTSLASLSLEGRDEEATEILAEVIGQISHPQAASEFITVHDWGKGFQRYLSSGDAQVPHKLVRQAERVYTDLCSSQRELKLLHGDLQHSNVLFDEERGWTAIDPKGVVGELEFEIGAALRNPLEKPELFASAVTVRRRLLTYEHKLGLDSQRMLAWSFAQAVLSAIWSVEDGFEVSDADGTIALAKITAALLGIAE